MLCLYDLTTLFIYIDIMALFVAQHMEYIACLVSMMFRLQESMEYKMVGDGLAEVYFTVNLTTGGVSLAVSLDNDLLRSTTYTVCLAGYIAYSGLVCGTEIVLDDIGS